MKTILIMALLMVVGCGGDTPTAPTLPTPAVPEPEPMPVIATDLWSASYVVPPAVDTEEYRCTGPDGRWRAKESGYHGWDDAGDLIPDSFEYDGIMMNVFVVRLDDLSDSGCSGASFWFGLSSESVVRDGPYPLLFSVDDTVFDLRDGFESKYATTNGDIKFHSYSWELDGSGLETFKRDSWFSGNTVALRLGEP